MIKNLLRQFIVCHDGILNRVLHIIGFAVVGLGIFYKNLPLVLAGAIIQELGHFYQYAKTREKKYSPLQCMKPQSLFAYPLFILILIYVIFA